MPWHPASLERLTSLTRRRPHAAQVPAGRRLATETRDARLGCPNAVWTATNAGARVQEAYQVWLLPWPSLFVPGPREPRLEWHVR